MFLYLVFGMFALALVTAFALLFITAPYGRHYSSNWGPTLNSRDSWIVMESPTLWFFFIVFSRGQNKSRLSSLILLRLFQFHYLHRVVVYPFRMKGSGKPMPILVSGLAFLFNLYNSYLQAFQISSYGKYERSWLLDTRFLVGLTLFLSGFCINVWADSVLFSLRKGSQDRSYQIPQGFLFEWISCPNYFGEMVEWLGWAFMTWSWAGLAFFVYTVANLGPRAVANHKWYLEKFEDYPKSRKAFFPFLI